MAGAHRLGNLQPEDAPSVAEPFDVETTAGGREEDLEEDPDDEPEEEPQHARPPQAWPANGRGAPPRARGCGAVGLARPRSQKELYQAAVEEVRRNVYQVDVNQAGEPVRPGYYKWWVNEYVREKGQPVMRRIIIEGGVRRIVVLFDTVASNRELRQWIAEKILHQRGEGPPPISPIDRRSWYLRDSKPMAVYDHAVAWCSII